VPAHDAGLPLTDAEHFRRLERLYAAAPVSRWFGSSILVSDGHAEVRIPVRPDFYHAAHAVHGSVYFRALDDAAFFAANSRVTDVFVLTVSFTIHFLLAVKTGELRAGGRLTHQGGRLLMADSELRDGDDRLVATGTGVFARSSILLDADVGYA